MYNKEEAKKQLLQTLGFRIGEIDESLMPLILDSMMEFAHSCVTDSH